MPRTLLAAFVTVVGCADDSLPIDCPKGTVAHELVSDEGVERWCVGADGVACGTWTIDGEAQALAPCGTTTVEATASMLCEGPFDAGEKHGAWTCHYDNDVLAAHQHFAHGVADGVWETFDRAGDPLSRGAYEGGVGTGTWELWVDVADGLRAHRSGELVAGLAEGPWEGVWDVDGEPRESSETRRAGLREGPYTQWWPNGQVAASGHYFSGVRVGTWHFFDSAGHESILRCDAHGECT